MQTPESEQSFSFSIPASEASPYGLMLKDRDGTTKAFSDTVAGLLDHFLHKNYAYLQLPVLFRKAMIRHIRGKAAPIGSLQAEYLRTLLYNLETAQHKDEALASALLMATQMDGGPNDNR